MAFTFVVETGEGLPNATSYASVAEATDYFTPDQTAFVTWDAFTSEQQEFYLALATRLLDQKAEYKGTIKSETQALRWPRSGVYNRDGILLSSVLVPTQIKQAMFELAKYIFSGTDVATGFDVTNLSRVKVDVIEIEFQEETAQVSTPSIINAILHPIGFFRSGTASSVPVVRTG